MVQPYPVYEELAQKIKEAAQIDIERVRATINGIGDKLPPEQAKEHYQEIAALILHHDMLMNNGVLLSNTPFEGKVMAGGKGIMYNFINLPATLQQIIALYIDSVSEPS